MSIDWIRIDPQNDWLALKVFDQADYMWASQLEKDKDVFAQFEAVEAFGRMPSISTVTTLVDCIKDSSYYYRIRIDAVQALTKVVLNRLFVNILLVVRHRVSGL